MNHRYLWYGAVLACAGDVVTTFVGIELLGMTEKNPIMAELMASIGVLPGLFTSKLALLTVAGMFCHFSDKRKWLFPMIPLVVGAVATVLNSVGIALTV